ncbi:hypothetical protein J2W88_003459 [Acidovorax delafieldii]|uniref:Uncharacterized protein n=1 Tax=Acidovorax delafieldii TaxID=47920 RepID=A0AAJ2BT73_ACIDE|nr:hypothetical protein [Acidovorax delafieldii]MDR6837813.1 hypothetical protein [Acidovorax delafieldii]MDR7367303.1 hypothetical protein [Acidovorax delafieldii]
MTPSANNAKSPTMPTADMTFKYVPMDGVESPASTALSVARESPK